MDTLEIAGASVPRVGFGTWQITGDDCVEAVRDALEIGYRHLDTARAYGNEKQVGEGLRASGVARDDVWITTKIPFDDLSGGAVRACAEASLRDLGVDSVDLLLIHWPNPDYDLAETIGEMSRLRDEGLVGHLGVSNFPAGHFRQALSLAPILTNQVEYHPFLGQDELLAIADENDSSVTAYAPIAHGKALKDETLREIGDSHGRGPAAIALRWLLDHHPRTLVVPKAASHENRVANFDLDFSLTEEQLARIGALPKDQRDFNPGWAPDWDA